MSTVGDVTRRSFNVIEALILAGLISLVGSTLMLREAVVKLQVNSENTNRQLLGLQAQLADVPALSQRVSRLEVRQDANIDAIKELRSVKGLR